MNTRYFKSKLYGVTPLLFAALAGLAGCQRKELPMTTLTPKADLAEWILGLYIEVTAWDAFIFLIVLVAFILAVFFFSSRTGEAAPSSSSHSDVKLEVAWTVGPALILVFISIPTVRLIFRTQPHVRIKDELTVTVVAHQWWWEFHYDDDSKVTTANELHIPVDRPIRLRLVSNDVIHSFWVPQLGGKRDVIPGQVNRIDLIAKVPGEYYGQCAEFCGLSHANMRFRVFVDSKDDFATWEKVQAAAPVVPALGTPAADGAQIYANSPCTTCHTIKGVSKGYIGPDLTHFASRGTIGSGLLKNDPENVARWIANPEEIKPGSEMPSFGVTGEQLDDLVAYLESLK